jgi:hypothetical protein
MSFTLRPLCRVVSDEGDERAVTRDEEGAVTGCATIFVTVFEPPTNSA